MLMFWVTDNFLMYKKKPIKRLRKNSAEQSLLQRVMQVQYRSTRNKERRRDSESDILLSDDDELLEANPGPHRNGFATNVQV